jgi:hypothetical protein
MTAGFITADLSSPLMEVFQHDICWLYYDSDVFWVTEDVGREHIDAILKVFSHDRHGTSQPVVEVQV